MTNQPAAEPRATEWLPRVGDEWRSTKNPRNILLWITRIERVGPFYFVAGENRYTIGVAVISPEMTFDQARELSTGPSVLALIGNRQYPVLDLSFPRNLTYYSWVEHRHLAIKLVNARLRELGRVEIREDDHD